MWSELTLSDGTQIGTPEGEEHKEIGPPVQREKEVDIDYSAQAAFNQAAQGVRNR